MWINILDEPIPTYGKNGKTFLLSLFYKQYYGHNTLKHREVVTAAWDSVNECFYEVKTGLEIDASDIAEWWKDN
jgi:hypothetical protein